MNTTECLYHVYKNYFNHSGHLPCGECAACRYEADSLERNKRWNWATDRGAKPNR